MKFIKRLKNYIYIKRLNNLIKSYKYVHIMFNDKFNKPFVDFLNQHFNNDEHLILCKHFFKEFPMPTGKNVIEINSLKGLKFDNCDKLICHSLFDPDLVDYLYNNQNLLKEKAHWVIWGGDLYQAPRDEKSDLVRRLFKGYIACIQGDELLAKEKYNSNANLYYALYQPVITESILNQIHPHKSDFINIQINNSADVTVIDMLQTLSKFKDKNINIYTILSYGDKDCINEILKTGKSIFKDKFKPIMDFMNPTEFAQHIANLDIVIFNQNRQQGVGNAFLAGYYGKKIYIKKFLTSYKYLTNLGLEIFDTDAIKDLSFNEFVAITQEQISKTKKSAKIYYDES
ncbi:TDP-N-acetylfucosamine:lipid II N-acetylfucosaminyltransferase, partial [Succinivibrio sp.]|uniref:TDP-N-acetylfucosamine:lipid II N-acetylfucosaminyltransferase n=1 Tax=Succinivibrio sp. TaxID=2053619 RepID=UPI003870B821